MNEWMMFMREDWSTITVGAHFRRAFLSKDPFEVIQAFMRRDFAWMTEPDRCIDLEEDYIDGRTIEVDGVFKTEELPAHLRRLTRLG
jgi:hypothetical protein